MRKEINHSLGKENWKKSNRLLQMMVANMRFGEDLRVALTDYLSSSDWRSCTSSKINRKQWPRTARRGFFNDSFRYQDYNISTLRQPLGIGLTTSVGKMFSFEVRQISCATAGKKAPSSEKKELSNKSAINQRRVSLERSVHIDEAVKLVARLGRTTSVSIARLL